MGARVGQRVEHRARGGAGGPWVEAEVLEVRPGEVRLADGWWAAGSVREPGGARCFACKLSSEGMGPGDAYIMGLVDAVRMVARSGPEMSGGFCRAHADAFTGRMGMPRHEDPTEPEPGGSSFCGPCNSYHPVPKDEAHHRSLMCSKPWSRSGDAETVAALEAARPALVEALREDLRREHPIPGEKPR